MTQSKDSDPAAQDAASAPEGGAESARETARGPVYDDIPPYESRRIPPSGDVSPDGKRIWPRPSLSAKILVWGGTGIAAAALTAGTILAARRIGEALRDENPAPARRQAAARGPALAPRFAELDDAARAQMRDRNRQRELEEALSAAHRRAEAAEEALRQTRIKARKAAARARPKARNLLGEVESNTRKIGASAESTINSLGAALTGFRAVAGQAGSIIGDFDSAAKLVRGLFAQGKEAAGHVAERAKDAAHEAGEKAQKLAESVTAKAEDSAEDLRDSARDIADDAAKAAERRMHRL